MQVTSAALVVFLLFRDALAQPKCPTGQTMKCKNGAAPASTKPPCSDGPPQCCTAAGVCVDAPKPTGGGAPPAGGGAGGGSSTCSNPSCPSPPCAAKLLGDIGCTTLSGKETYSHEMLKQGDEIATNAHIFGPFEAGFSEKQKSIIEGWGCTDASLAYDSAGGTDVGIAEKRVAHLCAITLPRVAGTAYFGIIGPCGGHTRDYHFHRSFGCLYKQSGVHSTAVGNIAQWKLYGKWEDFANAKLPLLDACGGHFGPTPDSNGAKVYHYHVQEKAPFSAGCHGPTADGKLVSVAACRALYPKCSGSAEQMETGPGTKTAYRRFCPCFDADGSNVGTKELPALSTTDISYTDPKGNKEAVIPGAKGSTANPSSGTTKSADAAGAVSGAISESSSMSYLAVFVALATLHAHVA